MKLIDSASVAKDCRCGISSMSVRPVAEPLEAGISADATAACARGWPEA